MDQKHFMEEVMHMANYHMRKNAIVSHLEKYKLKHIDVLLQTFQND
jgi:hypothetical protein